jgi:hypothetical protein
VPSRMSSVPENAFNSCHISIRLHTVAHITTLNQFMLLYFFGKGATVSYLVLDFAGTSWIVSSGAGSCDQVW